MKLSKRSNKKEWMDLGPSYYSSNEYQQCLYLLDRIGRYLGGDNATFWAFDQLKNYPQTILDVGCGGGLFTLRLAHRYPKTEIMGLDISNEAIAFANAQLGANPLSNIKFIVPNSKQLNFPANSIDIITATLVCHHLSDNELIQFLKDAYNISKEAIILNDLHRNPLATMGYALITPLLRNRMVIHDGFISIQRGFTRFEWESLLKAADIPLQQCTIAWHWAFRWIILINKAKQ